MQCIIVSGRSGSGKTIAIQVLADLGFYCVDNIPFKLLPDLLKNLSAEQDKIAVSLDARNLPQDAESHEQLHQWLNNSPYALQIVYLDAQDEVLLKRFSETRRRHPLSNATSTLKEAIQQEKQLLAPLANNAQYCLDTSELNKHQLAEWLQKRINIQTSSPLSLLLSSFGFKHGLPTEADFVFDVRCLPNPYWSTPLRHQSGKDKAVITFLEKEPLVIAMTNHIVGFLENWIPHFEADNRSYLTVAIGCTGGQHRSVYIAETIGARLKLRNHPILLRHRDLSP